MSLLKAILAILVFLMTVSMGLGPVVKASQSDTATFTFGFVWGSVVFPDEAHPLDTITCNLTVGAYIDVSIYNFTLRVSGFAGQDRRTFGTEQIASYDLAQGQNLTRQLVLTLPQSTSGKLNYALEASTDKGFGSTAFDGTNVFAITYGELSDRYNELLANQTTMQANYNELMSNYTSLKSDYDSLQQHATYLEGKYDASTAELTIVRYLMYALGVTTVILAATTVYFRKKAPYIVLRKETTAKPDN